MNKKTLIYFTLKLPGLKYLLRWHYSLSLIVTKYALRNEQIDELFIKGSYLSKSFELGYSDIDFACIINSSTNINSIEKKVSKINRFFPQIKDVDFIESRDFYFLTYLGNLKFEESYKWKPVYKRKKILKQSYFYSPLKLKVDLLDEFFFQIEWFYKNLEFYKQKETKYLKTNLDRILKKMIKIVSRFDHRVSIVHKSNPVTAIGHILKEFVASQVLADIDRELSRNLKPSHIYYQFDENRGCYLVGERTVLVDESYDLLNYDMYIPRALFRIFHCLGFINIDGLKESLLDAPENLFTSILWMRFKQRDIFYGLNFNVEFREKLNRICQDFLKHKPFLEGRVDDLLNQNTFVTVSWGEDLERLRAFVKASEKLGHQNASFSRLHIHLGKKIGSSKLTFPILYLEPLDSNEGLWHKESLYNIAIKFLPFTKNFIFSDSDVFSLDTDWLKRSFFEISESPNTFFQCFEQVKDTADLRYNYTSWIKTYLDGETSYEALGLVWGMSSELVNKINYIPYQCIDGSNDGAFMQELTHYKMGRFSHFNWFQNNIRDEIKLENVYYIEADLIHVNHGESRDYVNRGEVLDLFIDPIEKSFELNSLGLLSWKDNTFKENLELRYLYPSEEFGTSFRRQLNEGTLKCKEYSKFYSPSNPSFYIDSFNSMVAIESLEDRIVNLTNYRDDKEAYVKLCWEEIDLYNEEAIHLLLVVSGSFIDVWSELKINNHAHDGVQNRFIQVSKNKFYIDFCFSNFQQLVDLVPEITLKIPASESLEVELLKKEKIHMVHSWDFLSEQDNEIGESTQFDVENSSLHLEGWYRIDLKFDLLSELDVSLQILSNAENLINIRSYRVYKNTISSIFYKPKACQAYSIALSAKSFGDKLEGSVVTKVSSRSILL